MKKRLSLLLVSAAFLAAPAWAGTPDATIAGHVSITVWHCGGASLPPDQQQQGPCVTTEPFSTTFAVARPVDDDRGQYELVAWVTSDASGAYSVAVEPGVYTLVTKYEITHDPNDATGLSRSYVEPFTVEAGASVTKDFDLMTPPPPISIGVGN